MALANQSLVVLGARQTRKPLFLLEFAALFLLRYAARHLSGELILEPPRSTRFLPFPFFNFILHKKT
jgi:hypothetical protein